MDILLSICVIIAAGFAYYFFKKKKDKKVGWIFAGLSVLLFIAFGTLIADPEEEQQENQMAQEQAAAKQSSAEEQSQQAEQSKADSESISKEKEEKESKEEQENAEKDTELKEINDDLAVYLEQNKGWALGTIDEDGNKVENGEPNDDYRNWLYVSSIEYTGTDVEMKVTDDFKSLPVPEKEEVANSVRGMTSAYANLSKRPNIYIYNGEIPVGNTKTFSDEYNWE